MGDPSIHHPTLCLCSRCRPVGSQTANEFTWSSHDRRTCDCQQCRQARNRAALVESGPPWKEYDPWYKNVLRNEREKLRRHANG